jgi:hypothetical protein
MVLNMQGSRWGYVEIRRRASTDSLAHLLTTPLEMSTSLGWRNLVAAGDTALSAFTSMPRGLSRAFMFVPAQGNNPNKTHLEFNIRKIVPSAALLDMRVKGIEGTSQRSVDSKTSMCNQR